MAFVRYSRKQIAVPDVSLTRTLTLFSDKGWQKAGLVGTEHVNLYWDDKTHRIGLSSTEADDSSGFRAVPTGDGVRIRAKKFFATFGLQAAQVAGDIHDTGQVVAFKVKLQEREAQKVDGAVKRKRGRPRKAASV